MKRTLLAAMAFGIAAAAQAEVAIETVTVRNPGNPGEPSGQCAPGGLGRCRICGDVDYEYNIGKFEVSAGQYTEFLNAVAGEDIYGLYNTNMANPTPEIGGWGCNIQRSVSQPYIYSVDPAWGGRPVNYISWGDAARFANWLHNGQPTGAQNLTTTENGSYFLDGAMSKDELMIVEREADATWVIPSEDEWYKAAYHTSDGVTGNYFAYPTSSDSIPGNDLIDPDPGNNANCYSLDEEDYTIDSPYYRTMLGEFENSESAYGTFDQGGNVWEWNEAVITDLGYSSRGLRGGSWARYDFYLRASFRYKSDPSIDGTDNGFRVAQVGVPIPSLSKWGFVTMALLLLLGGTVLLRNADRVA